MKIVITGGTYAGKTTLIQKFRKKGFKTAPDAGLAVIQEINAEIGVDQQKKWRAENPEKFYNRIAEKQLKYEKQMSDTKNKPILYDRGIFDYLAMCKLVGIDAPKKLLQVARQAAYDFVFICEAIPTFSNRSNTGRSLNKKDSLCLEKYINDIYKSYGYKPVLVKLMPVSKRVKFILSQLKTK
jgi:predicted ATPase